jgi:8-oxo-dGTP pyrophosphatase MutT (NUDIX family)
VAKFGKTIQQAAVLAVHRGRICLITSSSGRHWLLPKGHLKRGCKLGETAIQEAWEEAGLIGELVGGSVGHYRFKKLGREYHVVVFRMKVTKVRRHWPEQKRRRRRWLSPSEALTRIDHAPLRKIVDTVSRQRKAA